MALAIRPGSCTEEGPGIWTWAICSAAAGWDTAMRVRSLKLSCSSCNAGVTALSAACLAAVACRGLAFSWAMGEIHSIQKHLCNPAVQVVGIYSSNVTDVPESAHASIDHPIRSASSSIPYAASDILSTRLYKLRPEQPG